MKNVFVFVLGKRIKLDTPHNANVYWSRSGSYNKDIMMETIKNLPDRSNLNIFCKEKGFAVYVLDDFAVHLMDEVQNALLKKGYIPVIIGGDITGMS